MKWTHKVLRRLADRLNRLALHERYTVLGRQLQLRAGTFRQTPDYDDAWFLACADHAGGIFDIGANVGYDAVLALACTSVERLALVEANPEALMIAAENLIRNQLSSKARLVTAFAGDTVDGTATLWTSGAGAAGSMYAKHAKTAAKRGESIEVPTITVDALCQTLGFSPDLIKIDVEGAESKVLLGASGLASQQDCRFLVEMHSNPDLTMTTNTEQVLAWCREVDYSAWYLKEHVLLDSPEIIAHRGRCHLLLQPLSWAYPDWLLHISQSAPLSAVKGS